MQGFMKNLEVTAFAFLFGLSASIVPTGAADLPAELTLQAKVRDFKEMNNTDTIGTDPMFNNQNGCSAQELNVNTVEVQIDTTGPADGGLYVGDSRGPKLISPLPASIARCYAPVERFGEWFSDQAPTINRAFMVDLKFVRDTAAGVYRFRDDHFFPIDNAAPYRKIHPTDPNPFGQLDTGMVDGVDVSKHNYGFTMELHTQVLFSAGKAQVLSFQGDDDIWVFVNGKRVVDLGGVHTTQKKDVNLDSLKDFLGLVDGQKYPLDFFFAERHTASSSCMITTNLDLSATNGIKSVRPLAQSFTGPVEVYDRAGRLIKTFSAELERGHAPLWDGRDAAGHAAAPGVYFWRTASALSGAGMMSGTLVMRM